MADQKPSNRERVKEIVAGIEQNIQELFQSERYFDYLRTMSRFHSYSVNNTILIHMQRPNASMPAAGFNKWKQFGRHVKKGEKGLTIIAPTPLKKKIEEMRLDPDTKTPVLDRDGNIIIDEKTVEIPLFKPVKVFTADQTDGKPLPSLAIPLTGDVQQYEAFMEALRRTSPMPISFAPLDPNTDGLCSFTKQAISIREGMSQVQTVCATVHEIGHAVLHDREKDRLSAAAGNTDKEPPKAKDKRTMEVEAESVSFAVCQYYGIDTSANSLGYIATWSKDKSLPELKASLETITKTVSGLISTIDRHFAEICKERGIDLTAQPEQAAPAAELPDTSEKFVMDLFQRMDDLHGSGQIQNPYGSLEPDAVRDHYLGILRHGNFSSAFTLLHELAGQTDTLTVSELRGRLDNLRSEWDAGLSYEIKPYIPDSNIDRFYLEASRQAEDGFRYNEVIFAGSQADCAELKQRLEENTITTYAVRELGGEDWPAPEAPSASQPDFEQTAPSIPPPPEQADEALYLLDDSVYLHIQASDGGWDYTLYTKHDMAQIDGGQLDAPGLSVTGVVEHIRQAEEIGTLAVDVVSLEVLEELRDHADHALAAETPQPEQDRDYAGELREHFAQEDAALLDTALDEYPMPDSTLTLDDLAELGYSETDLLPLSRDRGAELVDRDMTVYMIQTGENPEMVFDREDLMEQPEGVMFAIPREEWETSQDFQQAVADRIDRQEDRERAFLDHSGDCFAIYQVKLGDEESLRDIRYESLEWIKSKGRTVERGNYDLAYTAPLSEVKSADAALERLWYIFNNEHPADYQRPSMSVSDIIAIRLDGVLSFHYCDSYGFKQLPDFIQPENYLKNVEMAMEDDLGMIDGIINNGPKEGPSVAELEAQVKAGQTISLMDLAEAVKREKGEKKSVLAKLNAVPPQQSRKKTAPKKSAERER